MVAVGLALWHVLENCFFGHDSAERVYCFLEVLHSFGLCAIDVGFSNGCDSVILDLAYPFAGYAVLLPNGVERAAVSLLRQSVSVREDLSRALRKPCEQVFGHRFRCK